MNYLAEKLFDKNNQGNEASIDESLSIKSEDSNSMTDDLEISHISHDPSDLVSLTMNHPTMTQTSKSFGPAPFHKVQECDEEKQEFVSTLVPVPCTEHWWHRGYELVQLTLFEHKTLMEVKKMWKMLKMTPVQTMKAMERMQQ